MSENSITIEGKEYISSDRAAKLVGYTKDYVGQLARAGKIKSKRIGRSWYIEEESINKHKLSVHYILTKPKKTYTRHVSSSEIINKNIDISPILQNKSIKKENNTLSEIPVREDSRDEDIELIPRLKEKKQDALLHTDIRYEEVKTPEATYSKNAMYHKEEVHTPNNHFKAVSIRRSIPKRVTRTVLTNSSHTSAQRIDGIVFSSKKRERPQVRSSQYRPVETYQKTVPEDEYVNSYRKQEKETSKIIPVIGGIVLFTIFIVVYLVFSFA